MTYLNQIIKFDRKHLYKDAVVSNKKHPHRLNKDGIYVPHCYDEHTSSLSWWDDCGFVHHNRFIMVWWIHPRMAYQDTLNDLAHDRCAQLHTRTPRRRQLYNRLPSKTCIFARTKKIYKKTGSSRKKVWGYEVLPDPSRQSFSDCFGTTLAALSQQDNGIIIKPSAKIHVLRWCQSVELVIPEEVLCESDLLKIVNIARSVVDGDRNIITKYSNYSYDNRITDNAIRETEKHETAQIINT
jgi:hypothetical protein